MKVCKICIQSKDLEDFSKGDSYKDGHRKTCKECSYKQINREKHNENARNWRKKNPDKVKNSNLKISYGINLEQYNQMFNQQNGKCAICNRHQIEFKMGLAVDHEHETGKIRELLCSPCNQAIGLLQENTEIIQKVIDYLKRHK